MCALVAERLEADRLERRALTEAITLLARPGLAEGPSRVLGGTVTASSDISLEELSSSHEAGRIEAVDSIAIEPAPAANAFEPAPLRHEPIDVEPVEARAEAPRLIDIAPAPAPSGPASDAPVTVDLTAEERAENEPAPGAEIWNAFEKRTAEPEPAEDELELPRRQGTRLTAARRFNSGVSYR